jgi:hypothetical protein
VKAQIVFTVTREIEVESPDKALRDFECVADEPEEHLYGAAGGKERVSVALYTLTDTGHWWLRRNVT